LISVKSVLMCMITLVLCDCHYYYILVLCYVIASLYKLELFHILWCLPVQDLRNVNKFNSIQFNT
jgi:hypothetical protein